MKWPAMIARHIVVATLSATANCRIETVKGMTRMVQIAEAVSGALGVDVETFKTIIMFCGVGLTVFLMCTSYGLDLSSGFF